MADREAPSAVLRSPAASSAALAGLELDAPVCDLTRPNVDEWAVRRMWEGIQSERSLPPRRERPHVVALAAFAALASVLALILASTQLIASLREPAAKAGTAASATGTGQGEAAAAGAAAASVTASSAGLAAAGAPSVEPLLTREARRFEVLEAPPAQPPMSGSASARAGAASAPRPPNARVDFADGSSIEASPGARVEALASSADEFAVVVRRGLAQFRVTPGGPRRWRIDASHARVEVLGTVLWVESDDGGTSVRVDVGRVLVRSPELPGGSRHVEAGQALRIGAPSASAEGVGEPVAAGADGAGSIPAARDAVVGRGARGTSRGARREPLRSIERDADGAPPRASASATAVPLRSSAGVATAAAALWEGADEARRNGEPARAAQLLTELVEQFPADSQVALAAFTLGVLHLEHLARPFEASEWFQRALELGLGAALREDGYLRWAEALSRARDRARLAMVSAEYARLYPHGRHGATLEELVRAASRSAAPAGTRAVPATPGSPATSRSPLGSSPARDDR